MTHIYFFISLNNKMAQLFLDQSENLLDLKNVSNGNKYTQTYNNTAVVCLTCSTVYPGGKQFCIVTNEFGMYVLNNLSNISYTSSVYLPPNKTTTFNLVYSGSGNNWKLSSDVSIDVTVSPSLAWLHLFASNLATPPPKTSRYLANMGLCLYETLIAHPTMFDLAVANEVGKLVMAYYLPAVNTTATYDYYPKLSPGDLVTVTTFVNNLLTVTLAYNPAADNPVYAGPPPIEVPPYLWTGVNPVLPNWSLANYLGNGFTYTPIEIDPSTTMADDAKELLNVQQNLTTVQKQIGYHFVQSPPAHLIKIACQLLSTLDSSEFKYAQTMALVTMSVANAGVAAWTVKFKYWGARPSQFDPNIHPLVPNPAFPGFISGHSTFSAAWSTMLGLQVPRFKKISKFIADLSGISRIYLLIHFQSTDNLMGLNNGTRLSEQLHALLLPQIKSNGSLL